VRDDPFVSGDVGIRSRRRSRRARRRRTARLAVGAMSAVAVLAAIAFVVFNSGHGGGQVRADASPSDATSVPSTTKAAAPTTVVPTAIMRLPAGKTLPKSVLKLEKADANKPMQPPVAHYRPDNRLYLEGSVPSAEVAEGYLRKGRHVLGDQAVTMSMKLDPRAPIGPLTVVIDEAFDLPDSGAAPLDPRYDTFLATGKYALDSLPETKMVIRAYTDSVGEAKENKEFSQLRAQQVADFMIAGGVSAKRVKAIGLGEEHPVADNNTAAGRQQNRRVQGSIEGVLPY
jgi:outer membrane protein OmpA-like peptidoglycan-associated protein